MIDSIGRQVMTSILNEIDVKGTMSGKFAIFNNDGFPVDVLGHMLQRLGYTGIHDRACIAPDGCTRLSPYYFSEKELGFTQNQLIDFYTEIDRYNSTNETIRQLFHRLTNN